MVFIKQMCCLLSRNICHVKMQRSFSNQNWSQLNAVIPYRDKSLEYVKTKFNTALSWYEEISGLREVREAQIRVLMATELMKSAQIKRRDAKMPIAEQQKRLQDLQPELRNTPRDDDRYLYLIKEEHALLKDLKGLQERVQDAENEEREAFEQLMTSLRSSHEAERVQAEKTKYWSIIMSIIATIIGVVGTSLNNRYKMNQFRSMLEKPNGNETVDQFRSLLEESSGNRDVINRLNYLCQKVDTLSLSKINSLPVSQEEDYNFVKKVSLGVLAVIIVMWISR